MVKNNNHLKLSPRAIVVLVVFVVAMLVGTYMFAGYMLIKSRAAMDGGKDAPWIGNNSGKDEQTNDSKNNNSSASKDEQSSNDEKPDKPDKAGGYKDGISPTLSPTSRVLSITPTKSPRIKKPFSEFIF